MPPNDEREGKGDPDWEFTRLMSSDMGVDFVRGAIEYRAVRVVGCAFALGVSIGFWGEADGDTDLGGGSGVVSRVFGNPSCSSPSKAGPTFSCYGRQWTSGNSISEVHAFGKFSS